MVLVIFLLVPSCSPGASWEGRSFLYVYIFFPLSKPLTVMGLLVIFVLFVLLDAFFECRLILCKICSFSFSSPDSLLRMLQFLIAALVLGGPCYPLFCFSVLHVLSETSFD